jgi:hypothetical protein
MLHGAIFLATCNAILLLRDVKFPNTSLHYTPLMFSQHIENSSLILLINISQEQNLHCKLQEKLYRVTWPLIVHYIGLRICTWNILTNLKLMMLFKNLTMQCDAILDDICISNKVGYL